jgi:short subunit dehydrogenase-like uncharacterized protein
LKWAVAGRSQPKLSALVNDIKQLNPNRTSPGVEIADSGDLETLRLLAKQTKVLLGFAGPFAKSASSYIADSRHGSLVVQACAENGTHYADITGETPWYAPTLRLIQDPRNHPSTSSKTLLVTINHNPELWLRTSFIYKLTVGFNSQ